MKNWKKRTVKMIDSILLSWTVKMIDSILLSWTKREALLLAILLAVLLATDARAQGLQFDQFYYVNDQSCAPGTREVFKSAAKMWSFYAPRNIYEILNKTTDKGGQDGKSIVYCASQAWMNEEFGNGEGDIAGTAQVYADQYFNVWEADIALAKGWEKPCVMAHELGHGLGLAVQWNGMEEDQHSKDPLGVMYAYAEGGPGRDGMARQGCNQPFLMASDLVLVAERFDSEANCTPYIQKDMSIYFPYIAGYEAEAQYRPYKGDWKVIWYAPAPKAKWACALSYRLSGYAKNVWLITTELYDEAICVHANNCPTRRKSFSLERGILKPI